MFAELNKYKENDHFFYSYTDSIRTVCNAPVDKGGLYIVLALKAGRIELVQIESTEENEGLRDRILKNLIFLKSKLKQENIETLDIYWYVTQTSKKSYNPEKIKKQVLQTHFEIYERPPRWNKE